MNCLCDYCQITRPPHSPHHFDQYDNGPSSLSLMVVNGECTNVTKLVEAFIGTNFSKAAVPSP